MTHTPDRVRFAPSPTGMMHIGNVRSALMNFLFAKQKKGTFILRIEDTDQARNFDPQATQIIQDLTWLGLTYDEGPIKGGPYAPYFQSERADIYAKALLDLTSKGLVYPCFCTTEELERRRTRQIALKKPPRYDRTCLMLTPDEIKTKLAAATPHILRFKIDQDRRITIKDLAHGEITFDMKNFSDFPLTRSDESATFIFANFVDDLLMKISTVVRGEDHLTNTACQAMLYDAFNVPLPIFWHLPIVCSVEGKKLSKRDFGSSLRDLKDAGFLPEALVNYLAIIGGGTFKDEIMSLDELAQAIDFDHLHATGHIKYDVEKLKWMNNKWINRISPDALSQHCMPFLVEAYPQITSMEITQVNTILQLLKTDFHTLKDAVDAIKFYFENPKISPDILALFTNKTQLSAIVSQLLAHTADSDACITQAKELAKQNGISIKDMFSFMRVGLTGSIQGPSVLDLMRILGPEETKNRLEHLIG
jgi:glutamyl-tRNA synthetase